MLIKINSLQEARPEWVNIDTLSAKKDNGSLFSNGNYLNVLTFTAFPSV